MQVALNDIKPMNTNIKGDTSVARINMDGFAFQALSGKNLYKNVIRAIVREISCNALDAHVMAGTELIPFDVHIPTMLEPYFAVRDYGIGLDDTGVREIYLTYFGSTKRDSNTQIGAWGLGSKSPLGYTDNFTVTAIKDGVERIYSVFKNEQGIPSISIICENPTDKHNGLEIRLAMVDHDDAEAFKREALEVLQWFDVKPNFNVEMNFVNNDDNIMIDNLGGNIRVFKRGSLVRSVVVHGNIAYNLDAHMLKLGYNNHAYKLAEHGVQIFMEHGTVEYAMSREELSYTDRTIENIVTALNNATQEIVAKLKLTFDGVHQFDAFSQLESLKRVSFLSDTQYDELMKSGVSPLHLLPADHFDVENDCRKLGIKLYYKRNGRRGGTKIENGSMEYLYPNNLSNMHFYVNEEKSVTGLLKKLKYNIHLLTGKIIVIPKDAVEEFKQIVLDKLDYNIKVASSLELTAAPKARSASKEERHECVYRRLVEVSTGRSWRSSYDYKFEKDGFTGEPSGDEKYYVALKGYVNEDINSYSINTLCKAWGIERHNVYGVSSRHVESLGAEWIDLFAHLRTKVEAKLEEYKLHGKQRHVSSMYSSFINELEKHDDVTILRKAMDSKALISGDMENLKFACRILKVGVEFTKEMDDFDSLVDAKERELAGKYVLLAKLESGYHDCKVHEHMVQYIQMVNQL